MNYKKKIVGINTCFEEVNYQGFEEFEFGTNVSLLDYDAVVIYADNIAYAYTNSGRAIEHYENKLLLSNSASHQIVEDFKLLNKQLQEMLNVGKNIYVFMGKNESCFIYTGEKKYSGTGKNTRTTNIVAPFDTYGFLPISIKPTHIVGENISCCCNQPYIDFFKQTKQALYYSSIFQIPDSLPLARVSGTQNQVSATYKYGNGNIVFLPDFYCEEKYEKDIEWKKKGEKILSALFELDAKNSFDDELVLPKWTEKFSILDEDAIKDKLRDDRVKLQRLTTKIEKEEQNLLNVQRYKSILTASGDQLETIVKEVLCKLGFEMLEVEKGRSDIIARYFNIDIVAEIKGVTKSAAEKHAAQLEKWVAQFIEENERTPKALLIVNGFCDTPILERSEEVFPEQMMKYCCARGHILISTTQLLCLFIEVMQNPSCEKERINELLSSVGRYFKYDQIANYINFDNDENVNK